MSVPEIQMAIIAGMLVIEKSTIFVLSPKAWSWWFISVLDIIKTDMLIKQE
jgi:hypothetical protein